MNFINISNQFLCIKKPLIFSLIVIYGILLDLLENFGLGLGLLVLLGPPRLISGPFPAPPKSIKSIGVTFGLGERETVQAPPPAWGPP